MHKTVLTCINIYCSNMFTDYCNLKGGEGLWDNALKTNTLGLTSLGVEFVELWPLVVKPYVYAPGLKVRQPKLDQNGEEVRLANGRPAYETVHSVNEKWQEKISKLEEGIKVGTGPSVLTSSSFHYTLAQLL